MSIDLGPLAKDNSSSPEESLKRGKDALNQMIEALERHTKAKGQINMEQVLRVRDLYYAILEAEKCVSKYELVMTMFPDLEYRIRAVNAGIEAANRMLNVDKINVAKELQRIMDGD